MTDTPDATSSASRALSHGGERSLLAVLVGLAGVSLAGLVTGLIGVFGVGPVIILGAAAAYTLWSLWGSSATVTGPVSSATRIVLIVAVLVAVGSGYFATGRALADGEEAAHAIAATTLAAEGALVSYPSDGFEADAGFRFDAAGFVDDAGRTPDAPRLFTALAAVAAWFGPQAMFRLGAVLAGIAVLACYAFAARWLLPGTAAAVAVGLAASPLFLLAARDLNPVSLTLVFSLGGLWALDIAAQDEGGMGKGIVAGALLGCAGAASDAGLVLLAAVAVYLAVGEVTGLGEGWISRRRRRRLAAAVGAGAALPMLVALFDAAGTQRIGALAVRATALLVPIVIVALAGVARTRRVALRPRVRGMLAVVVPVLVVLAVGYAVVLRPATAAGGGEAVSSIAAAQAAEGVAIDPTRTYREATGLWLWWYAPGIMVVGLAGWALLAGRDLRDRDRRFRLPVVVTGAATALVLAFPGVAPLHPPAGFVFLPVVIPGLLVAAGWLAESLFRDASRYILQTIAVVAMAAVIVPGVWRTAAVWDVEPQAGGFAGVDLVCAALDRRDIVVVVDPDADLVLGRSLAPAIAAFCGVDATAYQGGGTALPMIDAGPGRVVLVTPDPEPLGPAGPRPRRIGELVVTGLRRSVEEYPHVTVTERWVLGIAELG